MLMAKVSKCVQYLLNIYEIYVSSHSLFINNRIMFMDDNTILYSSHLHSFKGITMLNLLEVYQKLSTEYRHLPPELQSDAEIILEKLRILIKRLELKHRNATIKNQHNTYQHTN